MTLREAQHELANLIAQLSILSEVPAVKLDKGAKGTYEIDLEEVIESADRERLDRAIAHGRPSGGVDRHADREPEFLLKSHDHYLRRARGCRSLDDYLAVIADVKATLRAWKRPDYPLVDGKDPNPGEPFFRRHLERVILENEAKPEAQRKTDQQLAWDHGEIDRSYVGKVRRALLEKAA